MENVQTILKHDDNICNYTFYSGRKNSFYNRIKIILFVGLVSYQQFNMLIYTKGVLKLADIFNNLQN